MAHRLLRSVRPARALIFFIAAAGPPQGPGAAETPGWQSRVAACQACHGVAGVSTEGQIPNLAGQKKNYLVLQLEAFRSGRRKNELMAAVAAQLSDEDIEQLARLWSQMPAAPAAMPTPAAATGLRGRMPFPADFPSGYSLYQTETNPAARRVVKRYANRVAVQAAREGRPLPNGSVLLVVNHEAASDADSGRVVAGPIQSYAAMQTQAGWGEAVPELLRNADWDYALFSAQGVRRGEVNTAPCFACHKPIAASNHVFTMNALQGFASGPAALDAPR